MKESISILEGPQHSITFHNIQVIKQTVLYLPLIIICLIISILFNIPENYSSITHHKLPVPLPVKVAYTELGTGQLAHQNKTCHIHQMANTDSKIKILS